MSYSVTVLLENGRRQRVTVKPNTPILVIIEDVCKKHKLAADDYDVKYHNRLLDVTSTVQFCGIANNSQLELVLATKSRTESPVTIFLQLESGERLSGSFLPSSSLEAVIAKLCGKENLENNPVIIYTRQEVLGEKLKTTTLKQLGLTGGSALLRLLHRTLDQLRNQSHSGVYNLPTKPKTKEPERRRKKEGSLKDFEDEAPQSQKSDGEVPSAASSSKSSELMDTDMPSSSSSSSSTANDLKAGSSGIEKLKTDDLQPRQPAPKLEDTSFNINDVKFIGERYALIFRTDQMNSSRFDDTSDDFFELTVDDAKTLLRDIKRTRSELEEAHLETNALRERKKSILLERTISTYPYCVVRIIFPGRIVLQGVFKSTETVREVVDFVKAFTDAPILQFYLYTAPPKTVARMSQSLIELGAVPGINFYFGGLYVEANPDGPFLRHMFLEQSVHPAVALRVANHFRHAGGVRSPQPPPLPKSPPITRPNFDDDDRDLDVLPPPPPNLRQVAPKSRTDGKVPKWFKPQ